MARERRGGNTPLPFNNVKIEDSFWSAKIQANLERTIPNQYGKLVETGIIEALRGNWESGMPLEPHIFRDSDLAKWVEGASYTIAILPDPKIEKLLDEVVDLIVASQQPDGYLNTHYTLVEPDKRWTNLRDQHELYCAGHLMEAAVAHYRATGKRKLLDCLCRYADHIDSVFGAEPGKKRGYCGHEEIELALVKLYEATGNERYLKLSAYFIDERGQKPHYYDQEAIDRGEDPEKYWAGANYEYMQAQIPVRDLEIVSGHAVRAMYLVAAMADLADLNKDETLVKTLERLWDQLVSKRMYITAGIGPSGRNEGFTTDYDLPNETAYSETCAAIGMVLWAHRMLRFDLDSKYGDVMERALYNGIISGVSLDGTKYFYQNPLGSLAKHHRTEWFDCSCCPTNIVRLIPSLGGYVYAASDKDAIVHLYVQGEGRMAVAGKAVTLKQETNFPWDGDVRVSVGVDEAAKFGICLRIPSWCKNASAKVNGEGVDMSANVCKGYLRIEREWKNGDVIELALPMTVRRIYAHPEAPQDAGRVAIQRGPMVYCFEEIDNPVSPHKIVLPESAALEAKFEPDLLGGVITLTGEALCLDDSGWEGKLYGDFAPATKPCTVKAIPYYAWDNRDACRMNMWVINKP
ncbi:MAG: glycoside hydrolase family 127 protein [Armatimonadetes bacterium]|nr:glycoside hydrolase family 127 protein [Armatimonadota bacterium]